MQPFPPEVSRRLEVARGSRLVIVFDGNVRGRARATFFFRPDRAVPISVTVDAVCDATWIFAERPTVRVAWWVPERVAQLDFATVRSFDDPLGSPERVRVQVGFGAASGPVVIEGDGLFIGPVDRPPPQQPVPAAYGHA